MPKILIVDDDPDILFLLRRFLEIAGYGVVAVADSAQAVQTALEEEVDMVILDIMMPGVSGYEVLQSLRQEDALRELPVVFLSARGGAQDRDHGLQLGANAYLTKPFDATKLIECVKGLI